MPCRPARRAPSLWCTSVAAARWRSLPLALALFAGIAPGTVGHAQAQGARREGWLWASGGAGAALGGVTLTGGVEGEAALPPTRWTMAIAGALLVLPHTESDYSGGQVGLGAEVWWRRTLSTMGTDRRGYAGGGFGLQGWAGEGHPTLGVLAGTEGGGTRQRYRVEGRAVLSKGGGQLWLVIGVGAHAAGASPAAPVRTP